MPMVERSVDSTDQLVAAVLEIRDSLGQDRSLWHRGQTCPAHSLTASLARQVGDIEKLLPLEQRLITRFRQRSLPFWPAGYPQDNWEQLFAMQHYGLPTRLLDWSENLFVGLYFSSLAHEHKSEEEAEKECSPVLWILDPVGWNRQAKQLDEFPDVGVLSTDSSDLKPYAPLDRETDLKRRYSQPLAIYGAHNSPRIMAQRGTFTITGMSLEPLESFARDHQEDALWKFALNFSREQLQNDLAALGFSESMIFPDLAGLAREIAATEGLK